MACPFVASMHFSTPSDCVHLSTTDLSDAAEDDNICMGVFHDCNGPVNGSKRTLNYHFVGNFTLCFDLKCRNSFELIGVFSMTKVKLCNVNFYKMYIFLFISI